MIFFCLLFCLNISISNFELFDFTFYFSNCQCHEDFFVNKCDKLAVCFFNHLNKNIARNRLFSVSKLNLINFSKMSSKGNVLHVL